MTTGLKNRRAEKKQFKNKAMEQWKDIKNYEGRYMVSDRGRIKNTKTGKHLKTFLGNRDYCRVGFYNNRKHKMYQPHRLVAIAFVNNPNNKPQINHKNGIKTDNRACNLEWCTHRENMKHAIKSGLYNHKGEDHHKAKLNSFMVRVIRKCEDLNLREIGEIFGVSASAIYEVKTGKRWSHVKS